MIQVPRRARRRGAWPRRAVPGIMRAMRGANSIPGGWCVAGALLTTLVAGWAGTARADTYRVEIESEPPGATISLGDGDELGTTPFSGDLPTGVHTLIFQRAGYETGVDVIEVRAKADVQRFSMQLAEVAYGSLAIAAADGAPALDGAEVWIDGEKAGAGPGAIRAEAGPHQVEIIKAGYETFEMWIELAEGETLDVIVTLSPDPDQTIAIVEAIPPSDAGPPRLVMVGGGVEFGGRSFRYANPQTANLRPYHAGGVPLLRVVGELYPLSRTGNEWLAGLAIVGGGARAFPLDSSTEDGERIGTAWSEYDIAARALVPVAHEVGAGVEAGHGRARFGFREPGELVDEVPDVDYRYARFGALSSFFIGRYEVLGSASYVAPYDSGATSERFEDASLWGMALSASVGSRFARHFDARLSAHYTRFRYSFESAPGGAYQADGGVDTFVGLSLGGYFRY